MTAVQYAPWSTDIELGFHAALSSLKIEKDRLDDSARKVVGIYELRPGDPPGRSARMQIHSTALTNDDVPAGYFRAEGYIKNYNTLEEYKNVDRAKILDVAARTIWDAMNDETIYSCPSLLCSFYAISYADLKKYKFTYHYAFPALHSDPPWRLSPDTEIKQFSPQETQILVESVQTWRYAVDSRQHGFFLLKRIHIHRDLGVRLDGKERPQTPRTPTVEEIGFSWSVGTISSYKNGFFDGTAKEDRFIAFADPSTYASNPGWMLRNYLVLIRQMWHLTEAQMLCYRDTPTRRDQPHSIILRMETTPGYPPLVEMPKVTGWERNAQNKLTSRTTDLGAYLDPTRLADQAVDLNLKLIKWRIAPSIDLDIVKNTSCLLLGAGTLGSYVSRNLMGWGVRKITFIDSATVSFSNPVRQPLFTFNDCLDGGAKKAERAAAVLKEIYPGVDSHGQVLNVPMVGHPILDEGKTKGEFETLQRLINEHDVIFLLLDSRESRWLPTLMGKAAGKIVLNAALGFESFVVMRQGLKTTKEGEVELGCYFCNDVVAPANSLKDATLDQQCTVTRPGIAPIASALLVELLVSILQHPLKSRAPAPAPNPGKNNNSTTISRPSMVQDDFEHPLGVVPHTLRGFLSNFNTMQIVGEPYSQCSACSDSILDAYRADGWEFVRKALSEKGWVEEVSGLAEVQRRAAEMENEVDWEEEDEEEEGEEEGDGELL